MARHLLEQRQMRRADSLIPWRRLKSLIGPISTLSGQIERGRNPKQEPEVNKMSRMSKPRHQLDKRPGTAPALCAVTDDVLFARPTYVPPIAAQLFVAAGQQDSAALPTFRLQDRFSCCRVPLCSPGYVSRNRDTHPPRRPPGFTVISPPPRIPVFRFGEMRPKPRCTTLRRRCRARGQACLAGAPAIHAPLAEDKKE